MSENIYLLVPNLIGYVRITLFFLSTYYMPFDHVKAAICYICSGFLDAVDGHTARWLNQSTKFGSLLDQLTDRCATMCLLVVLACFYPKWMFMFQVSMVIDIASHWIHFQVSIMKGKTSHKFIDVAENSLLRIYYTSKPILFWMCTGNELFYGMLYMLYFTEGPVVPILRLGIFRVLMYISFPISALKTLINVLQLFTACLHISIIDAKERAVETNEKE